MNESFKGVWIPSNILNLFQSKEISLSEAFLFGAIAGLENDDGCFASNDYFSELLNVHPNHISRMISNLKKKNLIEQSSFNGKKRYLKTISTDKIIAENSSRLNINVKADLTSVLRQGKPQGEVSLYKIKKNKTKRMVSKLDLGKGKKIAEDVDVDLTKKFLMCLPTKYQKPNIKNNSPNHFSMMRKRDKIPIQEIEKTIDWYSKNFKDQYTPKSYDAKTFRKKYDRILNAIERTKNQLPPIQEIEISSEAKKIVEQLQTKVWTKNTSEKLAPYVQLSLDNYKKFYTEITKLSVTEPDENLNRSDRIKFRKKRSLINHLIESLSSPTHFISTWFDNIWERTHNWEQWSGNLKPLVFSIEANEFEKHISDLFVGFGRSSQEATKFLSALHK